MLPRPAIPDARGIRRTLHTVPGRRQPASLADMPPDVSRRIRDSIAAKDPTAGPSHLAEGVAVVLIIFWVAAMLAAGSVRRFAAPLLFAFLLLGVIFALIATRRFALRKEIARAYLQERRCASCAYDLSGAEPAADGCSVCPECGAAWGLAP